MTLLNRILPARFRRRNKTLILHIGDYKTGSTSIQNAFAAGRVHLTDSAIHYPAKLNHNFLKNSFQAMADGTASEQRAARRAFRKLARKIRNSGAPYSLISSEELIGADPAVVKQVLDKFFRDKVGTIRVIGYVRPHPGKLLSSYVEQVKIGNHQRTLNHYLDRRLDTGGAFYAPLFQSWRDQFGESFILRPMIRDMLYKGSVVHDFVHTAFDQRPFDIDEGPVENESLSLTDHLRIKVVQSRMQDLDKQQRHTFGWEMARALSEASGSDGSGKLQLNRAQAQRIRTACLEDARTMDARFFDGRAILEPALTQAVDAAPETTPKPLPNQHLTLGEQRSLKMFGDLAAGLMQNEEGSWPAFFRARRIGKLQGADTSSEQDAAPDRGPEQGS